MIYYHRFYFVHYYHCLATFISTFFVSICKFTSLRFRHDNNLTPNSIIRHTGQYKEKKTVQKIKKKCKSNVGPIQRRFQGSTCKNFKRIYM